MAKIIIQNARLTDDPKVRIAGSKDVVNLDVAENVRRKNKDTGEWEDGTPTFWKVELWGPAARHIGDSLSKGTEVVIVGETRTRTWVQDGETRKRLEVVAESVSPSLRRATAVITKAQRAAGAEDDIPEYDEADVPPADDAWETPPAKKGK